MGWRRQEATSTRRHFTGAPNEHPPNPTGLAALALAAGGGAAAVSAFGPEAAAAPAEASDFSLSDGAQLIMDDDDGDPSTPRTGQLVTADGTTTDVVCELDPDLEDGDQVDLVLLSVGDGNSPTIIRVVQRPASSATASAFAASTGASGYRGVNYFTVFNQAIANGGSGGSGGTGTDGSNGTNGSMAAFDILSDRQRAVLKMRIIEERSPGEVADALGLSPGNVRVIQSRALSRVRRHLENRTKTRDRTAAGVMGLFGSGRLVSMFRDLSSALPSDGLLGAWIDHVRAAAATSGTGATATAGASATVAAVVAPGGVAASTALASQATATGILAAKVGAAGLGLVLSVGAVGAERRRDRRTPDRGGRRAPRPARAAVHDDQ